MKKLCFAFTSIALIALLLAIPVYAADIIVDDSCSLDDAIRAANKDTATGGCPAGDGADTITLTANVYLNRALTLITSPITIEGAEHTIRGNGRSHIIGINSRGNLTINAVILTSGKAGWGGAIGNLGGRLTITNSTLRNNSADQGGAIGNEGTLLIQNSTLTRNSASEKGGVIYNQGGTVTIEASEIIRNSSDGNGGAIFNDDGRVNIVDNSFLSFNTGSTGGALYNDEGTVNITNSTFLRNESAARYSSRSGGAIHNYILWDDDEDALTISGSTFNGNQATGDGGAIDNNAGPLTITNSTFINNSAGEDGGAIYDDHQNTITIKYSTFYGNSAGESGGGIYVDSSGRFNLNWSIIAGSKGSDCWGRLTANNSNLIEDGSCYAEYIDDPLLGELVEPEDGSPAYLPLLEGSPAIDSIPTCSGTDQIGTKRPQGEACDIGAIEYIVDAG